MKLRLRSAWLVALIVALIVPLLLRSAANDSIRGFDPDSQIEELKWEKAARAVPAASRIGEFIRRFSAQPHMAGTPQSKQTAEAILEQLRAYGLDAHIEEFEALLPQPGTRVLEMIQPVRWRARLEEPPVPGDRSAADSGVVPTYNAYSGDGDVNAPLVYVNYGLPADYELLRQHGIDVKGKIVIARYAKSFRGTKSKVAQEHGAAGCIIYSDPRDDGYFEGDVYPKGPFRPPDGVQRGTLLDITLHPGDPLSPGEPGSKRLALSEAKTVMKIPVLPISYADAQPLLATLEGPTAPEDWRGALPITYHVGPGIHNVHLRVTMNNQTRGLYDVIALIPGEEFPDQWVLDGNHHDAWVYGASDPLSGAAALMETAHTLATMIGQGWKPKRSILLTFWDGEEFGLIGSTEWMEKHADELTKKAVAYLNADSTGRGTFAVGGSNTLEAFVQEVSRDIADPYTGKPLMNALIARDNSPDTAKGEFRINALGSGSDYTPFLQHLGIASLDIRFASNDSGVYHSAYDDFNWYSHFSDSAFVYGRTLSAVHATALMRLADARVLPFEFIRLGAAIGRFLDEIEKIPSRTGKDDFSTLRSEILGVQKHAAAFETAYTQALPRLSSAPPARLAALNEALLQTERDLASDPGLPGRAWYRHRIYAPGKYTGYDAKTLPGVREAVEAGNAAEAREQADQVARVLRNLNDRIEQAQQIMGGF